MDRVADYLIGLDADGQCEKLVDEHLAYLMARSKSAVWTLAGSQNPHPVAHNATRVWQPRVQELGQECLHAKATAAGLFEFGCVDYDRGQAFLVKDAL